MKTVRAVLFIGTLCVLALGYAFSQQAFFTGTTEAYAKTVDVPAIRLLSLLVLLACVGMPFVRGRDAQE